MQTMGATGRISCMCGIAAQEITLGPSLDHWSLNLCHCTTCRTITGELCSSYYPLQSPPTQPEGLVEYQHSDCAARYFCRTCGAHVFAYVKPTGQYFVAAGLLERPPETKSIRHWGTGDTGDGGLAAVCHAEVAYPTDSCWLRASLDPSQQAHESRPKRSAAQNRRELPVQCFCTGIDLRITPPDASSTEASSPWPDLLVPYHCKSSANATDAKWWLRDGGATTRYLAGCCACRTCRLASGFPIQSWAFVPISNIRKADGSPHPLGTGTMQRYESSPGVYREFCRRCGATVFWHCDERPRVLDVSVGLLQADSGAMAEEWVAWATGRVSFEEMALDQTLMQHLTAGLREWGQGQTVRERQSDAPRAMQ